MHIYIYIYIYIYVNYNLNVVVASVESYMRALRKENLKFITLRKKDCSISEQILL